MPKIPVEKMKTTYIMKKIWEMKSRQIRERDADERGYIKCFTCSAIKLISEMDAGHYIHGKHPGTWLLDRNLHSQCDICNRHHSGRREVYALELEARYGHGILQELAKAHTGRSTWRRTELYKVYKELKSNL
ncbi:MAG TPA: hypothetical protein ENI23_17140 [bacterium]|nr:hypothetical protein [bacterium]